MLSTSTAVSERLFLLCGLRDRLARVLRSAFREAALAQCGLDSAEILRSNVLARFDAQTALLALSASDRMIARTQLCASAAAFARSALAQRIFRLPQAAIHPADGEIIDLIVIGRRHRRYGVCFTVVPEPFAILNIASAAFRTAPGLAGVVVYDLVCHRTRYCSAPGAEGGRRPIHPLERVLSLSESLRSNDPGVPRVQRA